MSQHLNSTMNDFISPKQFHSWQTTLIQTSWMRKYLLYRIYLSAYLAVYYAVICLYYLSIFLSVNLSNPIIGLELQTTSCLWLFQLDDSKSLHKKGLFHQTSIKKWLFRVPGVDDYSPLISQKQQSQHSLPPQQKSAAQVQRLCPLREKNLWMETETAS